MAGLILWLDGRGSDFARFKSSIARATPPPCDQDGNNAVILCAMCSVQCAVCSVLLARSKEQSAAIGAIYHAVL